MTKTTAYAKLDLAININPKKMTDGHYPVRYIDCQIDLCDKLTFENQIEKIEVICDDPSLPVDEDNFVYKAAILLKEMVGKKRLGTKITLVKNIPIKAGFGGGSSDAAATILGLSRLWKVKLSDNQIKRVARDLGKDFYYSYYGKVSEVVGKGKNYEIMPFRSCLPKFWLLVVVPDVEKPSTGWVYENLKTKNIGRNFDKQSFSTNKIEKLKTAIWQSDKMGILKNLTNDFEDSVFSYYPIIGEIKDDLARAGAQAAIMAGSGLSVVGFFGSKKKAEIGKQKLEGEGVIKQILVSKPLN
ncbi:4-(cytidine 5'-diphospho)-2-C-methyl-D-erythritol kinase [Candidatus Curtissbacteria bacterium RIFCSPLOWO2_01_FULL_41_18]|uniref:4-diphosphocytidyl-2-C-methyl-D-erythritol kinase n=1 Tax=Candidatus Curtissbacteria bacterium RIFCSPLOWO2_01_FULL_41_18 TaxID=1797727 RepID=A0A1F5HIA2_9BACT|nr:MAG: 4-(cytidine 5'-diphospho)-2-C-methyl-D-erythritol kinase [Candidatus Curtissbacteria bacterium RIFCSPLOWO2_01_FULL_41_18]